MESTERLRITRVLESLTEGGDRAVDDLLPLVYDEMRRVASAALRQEDPGATLQATALVHEAYIKLCGQRETDWRGRTHFFAVGAQAMRRILVDHARARKAQKRGGRWTRIELDEDICVSAGKEEDVLALNDALDNLAKLDNRLAEIVEMRFFGGLTVPEVAEVLGLSVRTIEKDWTVARAWLRRELSSDKDTQSPGDTKTPGSLNADDTRQ